MIIPFVRSRKSINRIGSEDGVVWWPRDMLPNADSHTSFSLFSLLFFFSIIFSLSLLDLPYYVIFCLRIIKKRSAKRKRDQQQPMRNLCKIGKVQSCARTLVCVCVHDYTQRCAINLLGSQSEHIYMYIILYILYYKLYMGLRKNAISAHCISRSV